MLQGTSFRVQQCARHFRVRSCRWEFWIKGMWGFLVNNFYYVAKHTLRNSVPSAFVSLYSPFPHCQHRSLWPKELGGSGKWPYRRHQSCYFPLASSFLVPTAHIMGDTAGEVAPWWINTSGQKQSSTCSEVDFPIWIKPQTSEALGWHTGPILMRNSGLRLPTAGLERWISEEEHWLCFLRTQVWFL